MEESIEDFELKGKPSTSFLQGPWFTVILVMLVAISAFALGRISRISENREPVRVLNTAKPAENTSQAAAATIPQTGTSLNSEKIVGSKNGTKYHLSTCPGAKQIAEKNKITFASVEEARAKGYTPASNCPGLK